MPAKEKDDYVFPTVPNTKDEDMFPAVPAHVPGADVLPSCTSLCPEKEVFPVPVWTSYTPDFRSELLRMNRASAAGRCSRIHFVARWSAKQDMLYMCNVGYEDAMPLVLILMLETGICWDPY